MVTAEADIGVPDWREKMEEGIIPVNIGEIRTRAHQIGGEEGHAAPMKPAHQAGGQRDKALERIWRLAYPIDPKPWLKSRYRYF